MKILSECLTKNLESRIALKEVFKVKDLTIGGWTMSNKNQDFKIAVVLCTCGRVLEEKIDFKRLEELAKGLPQVTKVLKVDDLCKAPEQRLASLKGDIDRVLFVGCSERSSLSFGEYRIQKLLQSLDIDPGYFEVANIKEQCAMVHEDPEATTLKALDLFLMAYEKLKTNREAHIFKDIKQEVLVVGGGVAGLSCAQALSDLGVKVCLVEEKPYIGGHLNQIPIIWQGEGFAGVCVSDCLGPVVGRETIIKDNIELLVNSTVTEVVREDGNFRVKIEKKPLLVDPHKCVSCGKCRDVCPEEIVSDFNLGLKKRKVIDKDFKLAIPDSYTIVEESCTKCGECVEVCPTSAINLDAKPENIEKGFGSVVLATGFNSYDMSVFNDLGYKYPNVVTMMEFERLWANKFNGKPPISIAFVLCQKDEVGYCSRLCCMATMKHTVRLSIAYLGTEVNVFYKSLRTCGRAFEDFRREAELKGVEFLQEDVLRIEEGEEGFLKVITNKEEYDADLVVLAEPLVPSGVKLAKMFGVELDKYGFPIEYQPRAINPLETHVERVFVVGTAKGFKDIQESIESGKAAAIRIYNALKGREQKYVSGVEQKKCSKCGMCLSVCPHNAISMFEEGAIIDPAFCKGCGLCYATCSSKAIKLMNLEDYQLIKMAEVAFKHSSNGKPRILTFLCYWCSYAAGDLMGVYGEKLPETFRSVRIRCSASINPDVVMEILARDLADGVVVAGCPPKNCHHLWGNDMQVRRLKLLNRVFRELDIENKTVRWEYIGVPLWPQLANIIRSMDESLAKYKKQQQQ